MALAAKSSIGVGMLLLACAAQAQGATPQIIRPSATLGPAAPGAPATGKTGSAASGTPAAAAPTAAAPRLAGVAKYRSVSKSDSVMFDEPS